MRPTKQGIEVNVCGEMSGDPLYTMLLLGMGLRQLSVTPQNIPEIKKIIRLTTLDECAARGCRGAEPRNRPRRDELLERTDSADITRSSRLRRRPEPNGRAPFNRQASDTSHL